MRRRTSTRTGHRPFRPEDVQSADRFMEDLYDRAPGTLHESGIDEGSDVAGFGESVSDEEVAQADRFFSALMGESEAPRGRSGYAESYGESAHASSYGEGSYAASHGEDSYAASYGEDSYSTSHGEDAHTASYGEDAYAASYGEDAYASSYGEDSYSTSYNADAYASSHGEDSYPDAVFAEEDGDSGEARVSQSALVRWVQAALGRSNVGPVAVDGMVGPQTREALRRFQQQQRLRQDSRLLSDTLHALVPLAGSLPPGVWPDAPPTHGGREPDLSAPCADSPTILDRFVFASAQPTATHRTAVTALASTIAASWSTPEPVHWVCLRGHTDEIGAHGPNEGLGQRRAEAIEALLVAALEQNAAGLSRRVGLWSTTAGETEPLVPNTSDDNRARNRRVDVRFNRRWRSSQSGVTVALARGPEGDGVGESDAWGETDPPYQVPIGRTIGLVATGRQLPVGNPAYTWTSANPGIATATQPQGTQQHPNQVDIRGIAAGRTTVTVSYQPASGTPSAASVEIEVPPAAPTLPASTRYGCHDLRKGDRDTDPGNQNRPKWGGQAGAAATVCQPPPTTPPVNPTHVRDLQNDLRTLGFLIVGTPSGVFDLHTEWAVRELQIYAKMANVARVQPAAAADLHRGAHLVAADNGHDAASNLSAYVASLEQVANAARYTGNVSGVVNAATRSVIDHWITNEWRCPVIIEAWRMNAGARQRNAAVNLWAHNSHPQTAPRMFARDFTGYYTLPTGRNANDMHVIGDYAELPLWQGTADARTFSGPRSAPRSQTWTEAEMLPAALVGDPAPTGATLSTYRVVRSVSEVECMGFFDSINAYDNAFISLGPCHWTMGIVSRGGGISEGELPGFLAYLRHIDAAAYRDAFQFFGASIDESWVSAAGPADGADMFSSAQRKYHGWPSLQREDGTFARMTFDEVSCDYFKTWHWHYRFVMAGRTIDGYRRRMWDAARIRIRDLRNVPWGPGVAQVGTGTAARPATIGDVFTSERAIAMLFRWHIFRPGHVAGATQAGNQLRAALPAAQAAGSTLTWTGDPTTWTNAHETHLVEALRVEARRVAQDSTQYVHDWPTWLTGTNPRGYTLAAPVAAALATTRNSFDFDTAGLPPAPP